MRYDYHIVVIGAGSGGLVVAAAGASAGARVALIEKDRMGGDCLNTGCVPSKSFLKPAHLAAQAGEAASLGLSLSLKKVDLSKVMKHVSSVIKAIEPHDSVERFTGLGVDVIPGNASLVDRNTVSIGSRKITGKYIVIATGSRAAVPPIPGLDSVKFHTNESIFSLKKLPTRLIVLGAGPIGLELGQGFQHLGSRVEIIDMADRLFIKDDDEVGPLMEDILKKDGIKLHLSSKIMEVKKKGKDISVIIEKSGKKMTITGDQLLVSLGRVPVSDGLNLDKAGVEVNDRGYIETNDYMQTSAGNIYACGDIVGPYQFTHMAGYQAGIVIRNIIFPLKKARADYSTVPWTTYTRPEVAHVGYTEAAARDRKLYRESIIFELGEIDRARAENESEGFLKLILGKKGKIIGATLVGEKAGEIIPLASMAIKMQLKGTAFLNIIFSYPTEAEIFKMASLELYKKSVKPWMKSLLKKIVFR